MTAVDFQEKNVYNSAYMNVYDLFNADKCLKNRSSTMGKMINVVHLWYNMTDLNVHSGKFQIKMGKELS